MARSRQLHDCVVTRMCAMVVAGRRDRRFRSMYPGYVVVRQRDWRPLRGAVPRRRGDEHRQCASTVPGPEERSPGSGTLMLLAGVRLIRNVRLLGHRPGPGADDHHRDHRQCLSGGLQTRRWKQCRDNERRSSAGLGNGSNPRRSPKSRSTAATSMQIRMALRGSNRPDAPGNSTTRLRAS